MMTMYRPCLDSKRDIGGIIVVTVVKMIVVLKVIMVATF